MTFRHDRTRHAGHQRIRPEKLAAWQALRELYGNRDESTVGRGGTLLAPAA
jgi:hypothetical protein